MNSTDIVELFEGLAKTDITNNANIQTMRRLKEELSKFMPTLDAQTIVALTKIEVAQDFPEKYKNEFDRCVAAFAQVAAKVKAELEEILGDKWKDALRSNPLEFKINL